MSPSWLSIEWRRRAVERASPLAQPSTYHVTPDRTLLNTFGHDSNSGSMSIILSSTKWGQVKRPINVYFKPLARVRRPSVEMLSTISSRAWIQESALYSALKDGTPGSEYSFPNQEIIIALKSRFECTTFFDSQRIPIDVPYWVVICNEKWKNAWWGRVRGPTDAFGTFSSVQLQRSALCHNKLHAIQPGPRLRLTPPDQAGNPV
jgi:hypothetical protein